MTRFSQNLQGVGGRVDEVFVALASLTRETNGSAVAIRGAGDAAPFWSNVV